MLLLFDLNVFMYTTLWFTGHLTEISRQSLLLLTPFPRHVWVIVYVLYKLSVVIDYYRYYKTYIILQIIMSFSLNEQPQLLVAEINRVGRHCKWGSQHILVIRGALHFDSCVVCLHVRVYCDDSAHIVWWQLVSLGTRKLYIDGFDW